MFRSTKTKNNATQYKSQGKRSLFDEEFIIEMLSSIGNPLETISEVIDIEMFRSTLESKLLNIDKKIMWVQNLLMWYCCLKY